MYRVLEETKVSRHKIPKKKDPAGSAAHRVKSLTVVASYDEPAKSWVSLQATLPTRGQATIVSTFFWFSLRAISHK